MEDLKAFNKLTSENICTSDGKNTFPPKEKKEKENTYFNKIHLINVNLKDVLSSFQLHCTIHFFKLRLLFENNYPIKGKKKRDNNSSHYTNRVFQKIINGYFAGTTFKIFTIYPSC